MAKIKAHIPNLYEAVKDVLEEYKDVTFEQKEQGLNKASDYLKEKYSEATPEKTGKTKNSWIANNKYRNVKYIYNTNLSSQNIPIANLIEFSKNGKPFMRLTFEKEKDNLIKIITEELKK